jgi:DNA sulfur modification protein DndC
MNLLKTIKTSEKYYKSIKQIQEVYKSNKLPFVVGYSGGKDSTLTTQLVFEALKELDKSELTNQVYVISSNTLVETPPVIDQITITHQAISQKAKELNLPITTKIVHPLGNQTFWANIIGRGYPSPNQTFRWCTDRMKIDPANRYVKDVVSDYGEVIMVLGVREGESSSRDRVLNSHSVDGKVLMKHSTLNNAFVFAPIKSFTLDEVWDNLLKYPSPWGGDNLRLYELYANSNDGECPLIIDEDTKNKNGSCGNSRMGCWTCTVVDKDKSLTGFIESGEEWLRPLLQYRNWLVSIRDNRMKRMKKRTGGAVYFSPIAQRDNKFIIPKKTRRERLEITLHSNGVGIDEKGNEWRIFESESAARSYLKKKQIDLSTSVDPRVIARLKNGMYGQLGLGPYTMEARKEILKKLLVLERNLERPIRLITDEELFEIRKIWIEHGDLEDSLPQIYKEVYGTQLHFMKDDLPLLTNEDLNLIKSLCEEHGIDYTLYKEMVNIGRRHLGNTIRRKAVNQISSILRQDYLHIGDEL